MSASPILKALFGATKARAFQSWRWPSSPVIHHGPVSRLPEPFRTGDLSTFDRIAATAECDSEATGFSAPGSGYRGDISFSGGRGQQRAFSIRAASASRLLQAGLNVSFHEFSLPSLEPWLADLAREVGIARQGIRLYGFAAPRGGVQGTDPHWDPNEVINVQLQGSKLFRLAPNAHTTNPDIGLQAGDPCREDLVGQLQGEMPVRAPRRWREITVRPGSVVYLPRGYWHETETSGPSFGVTMGFYWPTASDVVLAYLGTRLRQHPSWREPLCGILRQPLQGHHVSHLEKLLGEFGISPDLVPPVEAIARTKTFRERVSTGGLEGRYMKMPFEFSKRRHERGSSAVLIRTNKGHGAVELEMSPELVAAIGWIADHRRSFTLGDLVRARPRLDREEIEDLLAILIEYSALQFDPRR